MSKDVAGITEEEHNAVSSLLFEHVSYAFFAGETMKAFLKSSDGLFVLKPKVTIIGRQEDSDIILKVISQDLQVLVLHIILML